MDLARGWHPLADVLVEGEECVGGGGGWTADNHVLDGASRSGLEGGRWRGCVCKG